MKKIKIEGAFSFLLFKKTCQEWINKFDLNSWEIEYAFKNLKGMRGRCNAFYHHHATLILDTKHPKINDPEAIKLTAFHEVCELLLSDFDILCDSRYNLCRMDVDKARHAIINRLVKVLLNG